MVALSMVLTTAASAAGQSAGAPATLPHAGGDTVGVAAAGAAADTGRMQPGHRDYRQYDLPEMCQRAVWNVQAVTWRDPVERDTLAHLPSTDTLPTAAVAAGRACMAQLATQRVEPRDLFSLMQLALMVGDDAQAGAITARRLALARDVTERAEVMLETVRSYVHAQPPRVAAVTEWMRRLDAVSAAEPPARRAQLSAHASMLRYTRYTFDRPAMTREAEAIIMTYHLLSPGERQSALDAIGGAYEALADVALYENPSALENIERRAQQDAVPDSVGWPKWSAAHLGQPAGPLTATYRYYQADSGVRPARGRVTLFFHVSQNCTGRGGACYPEAPGVLRRLARKYRAAGLDIVLLMKTDGYSRTSGPQTLQEEAASAKQYFLHYLGLPADLFIVETQFTRRPDRRLDAVPVSFGQPYAKAHLVLVGRDGTIQLLIKSHQPSETELDAYVRRAVGGQSSVTQ
ncbi:MAG TPA: hypothetical protein VNW46_02465 [Gemmatimonadaceae bacterium]|nr:hypothetical protein [Gemmatimonadaceae bacterium]